MNSGPFSSPAQRQILRAISQLKHLLATSGGVLVFSVGALFILLCSILSGVGKADRNGSRQLATRKRLARLFSMLLAYSCATGLLRKPVLRGAQNLQQKTRLIAASHPSLIDSLLLLTLVPTGTCVVKSSLWRNTLAAALLRALGYISNEADDMVAQCVAALEQGQPLIIFPEGTRTTPGAALKLSRGCAHIALSAGVDITPVVIHCQPRVYGKDQGLFGMPPRLPEFSIEVFPAIDIAPYRVEGQPRSLTARRLTEDLQDFFCGHYQQVG